MSEWPLWMLMNGNPILRLALAAAGALLIAGAAFRLRALSRSGAAAAAVMGTGYVACGGPIWFGLLMAFFVSSTLWSKWKKSHAAKHGAEKNYAKGSRRDWGQVAANGGIGLLLCVLYSLRPEPWLLYAFAGVMASVNADTWATEIGALSRSRPVSVRTLRRVPPGTSGGVTPLGSFAALAGGAFIGACAALLAQLPPGWGAAAAQPRRRLRRCWPPAPRRAWPGPSPIPGSARRSRPCTAAAPAAARRSAPYIAASLPSGFAASPG